ncbi:MAG: hypothetical protein WAO19_07955 [Candidatus Kryptoniota bacterium]
MSKPSPIEFEKEFSDRLTIHKNLQQEVLITTVDKVRICLMNNVNRLTAKQEWVAPLGIFITLVATLFATDFKEFIIKPEVWHAMYILSSLGVLVWLGRTGYKAWKMRSEVSVNSIIDELKNTQRDLGWPTLANLFLTNMNLNLHPKLDEGKKSGTANGG